MSEAAHELPVTPEQLADVVGHAADYGEITYLTRGGRRLAAVVPVEVAEKAEADEAAQDAAAVAAYDRAVAEGALDEPTISLEDLMAELGDKVTDQDIAEARARLCP